jgi:hypothetical protein
MGFRDPEISLKDLRNSLDALKIGSRQYRCGVSL